MSTLLVLCILAFGGASLFAMVVMDWRQRVQEQRLRQHATTAPTERPMVSVLVPARHAAGTIVPLLQDIYGGRYPRERTEVMVVDDGGDDGTAEAVRGLMRTWPQLRLIANEGAGKKAAITTGVRAAQGEWVLLTDADVRSGPQRVERFIAAAQEHGADLLLGPVRVSGEGLLGGLQATEAAALLAVAAGTASAGRPMLANGANMAFRKAAFEQVHGFEGDRWASGDDIFLLHRMERAGLRVHYVLEADALVEAQAEPTWSGFLQQRLRWAGKMRGVKGGSTVLGACGMLLPWALLALTCSLDPAEAVGRGLLRGLLLLAGAWVLWLVPVLMLVREARRFLAQRSLLVLDVLYLLAFTVYAPLIAIASLFVRPRWKGRRI